MNNEEKMLALLERMDSRFDRVDKRLDQLEAGQAKLEAGQAKLEAGQKEIRQELKREIRQVEEKLDLYAKEILADIGKLENRTTILEHVTKVM